MDSHFFNKKTMLVHEDMGMRGRVKRYTFLLAKIIDPCSLILALATV